MSYHVRGCGFTAPMLRAGAVALAAVLAMLVLAGSAWAQGSGTIQGRVLAAGSGEPLSGVSVVVTGTGFGALTDAQGGFRLAGVPAGTHQVVAQRVGLGTARRMVELEPGAAAEVEFRLSEQALLLPEVVVSASREAQRLSETAATVGVVSSTELRETKPTHPSDVMQRIPGVWVNVTGGEGHMTAIRQPMTTKPMYLFLEDGVPTRSTGFFNHNALYEINLPQAERIEVLKGPATALYGSDAIGGVVNVETRRPSLVPSAEAYAEGGAFGWTRLLASGGNTWGKNGLRADMNLTHSDGWREGTGYDRQSGTVRWDHAFGSGTTLKMVLTGSRIDQQTAGSSSLLREDYLNHPTINYTPVSLRNVRAVRLSSAFEKETAATLFSLTPYARWNEMELLPNWSLTYDPTIYTTGHSSPGVLAKVRRDFDPIRTRLIAGVDVDYSPGGRLEHKIDPVRQGQIFTDYTRGAVLYDYDVTFRSVSPYLQVEASPTDRLHLTAGLRYDRTGYDYDTELDPLQTGRWRRPADTEVSYDHLSPKLGATYDFGRALNVYANYTHGFRAPSEGQLFRQGSAANTVGLEPVAANSYEAGLRGEVLGRLGYSLAAYRMTVENDILTYIRPDGIRETVNAGETLHRGIEVGLGAALTNALRADLSYSLAEHTYEEWSPKEGVDYSGNEMEDAPNVLASARLSYAPSFLRDGRLALEWRRVGSYWMDAENTHEYPGHDLWNLYANVPVTRSLELVGRLANIADVRYAESASFTQFRGEEFAPGMPRTVYLGVQYRWKESEG
jgi:iron complex outermembrane receptor protein